MYSSMLRSLYLVLLIIYWGIGRQGGAARRLLKEGFLVGESFRQDLNLYVGISTKLLECALR